MSLPTAVTVDYKYSGHSRIFIRQICRTVVFLCPIKKGDCFMKYDVIIVGAGPAGIFTALEMLNQNTSQKLLLLEKGVSIAERRCPKPRPNIV